MSWDNASKPLHGTEKSEQIQARYSACFNALDKLHSMVVPFANARKADSCNIEEPQIHYTLNIDPENCPHFGSDLRQLEAVRLQHGRLRRPANVRAIVLERWGRHRAARQEGELIAADVAGYVTFSNSQPLRCDPRRRC